MSQSKSTQLPNQLPKDQWSSVNPLEQSTQAATSGPLAKHQAQNRSFEYDFLKALAIIGVVYIHSSVMVTNFLPSISDSLGWLLVTWGNAFFRWSVPVFVMTSGALLLRREHLNTSLFYRRRLWRIGIPLVVWTILYELSRAALIPGESFNWLWVWQRMWTQQPYQHLYFMVILLGLMILTPWLSRVLHDISKRDAWWMAGLFLWIGTLLFHSINLAVALFIPYIGYYITGYLMHSVVLRKKTWLLVGAVMISVASFLTIVTFVDSRIVNILNDFTRPYTSEFAYLSPFIMLLGICAFVFFRQPRLVAAVARVTFALKAFTSIGQRSLGIYMIHPIVLLLLYALFSSLKDWQMQWPVPVTLGLWLATTLISWAISALLHKVAFLRYLV